MVSTISSLPEPPFVIIDDARDPAADCYIFTNPEKVVVANSPEEVPAAMEAIEAALAEGHFVAGFLSYELGYVLEPKLLPLLPENMETPLIWMGIFKNRRVIISAEVAELLNHGTEKFHLNDLRPDHERKDYIKAIGRILDAIAAGEVYQINYTFKYRFGFSGSAAALYGNLRRRQRGGHCALVATGDFYVLSLSPELFFEVDNGEIRARPMKGTAGRAPDSGRDNERKAWLATDEKSRAENLMIVDLVRNDLGRISEIGSVEVSDLFTVETYPTLHQMTSGIKARLEPEKGFGDLVTALFPCGSVSGAPKVRAMEIIRDMEAGPRGVYTGAVGWAGPGGNAAFNVAIRTLVVGRDGQGEMGVGGGIVFDSEPAAEYEECLLKARFLSETTAPFSLIETMRLENGTFYLLDRHIRRLESSARFFGYPFDQGDIRRRLASEAEKLNAFNGGAHRVRFLLDENGNIDITSAAMAAETGKWTFTISPARTDRRSPFTFHKTTNRELYDRERAAGSGDEVVFLNDRGEITEGSMTNIFIELNGLLLTPMVACGLLAGTFRQELIDMGKAQEAVLTPEDMERAEQIFLANSVRGMMPARRIFTTDRA